MAWIDPTSRLTGDSITATIWNQDAVLNAQFLHDTLLSKAVLAGTSQSVTSGAYRTLIIDTEIADPENIVTISSNQFTPTSGKYFLIGYTSGPASPDYMGTRLYNATAASSVQNGGGGWVSSGGSTGAVANAGIMAYFTANGTDAYEWQMQVQNTGSSSIPTYSTYEQFLILIRNDD